MLQIASKINPNGIDSNYFYANYLQLNKKLKETEKYFERAIAVPARTDQIYADNRLKEDAGQSERLAVQKSLFVAFLFVALFNSKSIK